MFKSLFSRYQKSALDPYGSELIQHLGKHYLEYIQAIAASIRAERYLEVGTSTGNSLARISCASIAIDPKFQINQPVTGRKPKCLLFQVTSDAFFQEHDPKIILGGTIDLAFLDGLHRYENLLRDFCNTEKHCGSASVILLHDCLPPTFEMTNREGTEARLNRKYRGFWTGDVWKVVMILQKYRPDLKLALLDCPPTGLIAISNLDNQSRVLAENFDQIIEEFLTSDADFESLQAFIATANPIATRSIPVDELIKSYLR